MKLKKGDQAPLFTTKSIQGDTVSLEKYKGKKIMLCFNRYAGCPFCNLNMQLLLKQYEKYKRQGLFIISFYQSSKESVLNYHKHSTFGFPVIADSNKTFYDLYHIETSIKKTAMSAMKMEAVLHAWLLKKTKQGKIDGELFLVPGQFLINPDLTIHTAYYANNLADTISLYTIESFLKSK